MSHARVSPKQNWFCVEDCANPRKPQILLHEGSLADCHEFIQNCRSRGRKGIYRVNYSPAMRRYLQTEMRPAA